MGKLSPNNNLKKKQTTKFEIEMMSQLLNKQYAFPASQQTTNDSKTKTCYAACHTPP